MREFIHAVAFMSFLTVAFGLASHQIGFTDYVLDQLNQDIKTSTVVPRDVQNSLNNLKK